MSSFQIASTTATFRSTIRGSRQTIGDLQEFAVSVLMAAQSDWLTLQSLVTTKYHVHVPFGGSVVVDVVRGPGAGTLVIDNLGTTNAILTQLERPTYLPNGKTMGTATFLVTGTAV
jgi:hypothetical protein